MTDRRYVSVLASILAGAVGSWVSAAEPPMGSAEFVPTPDRPVGFRGDGSGIYPGATPPTEFSNTKNLLWVTKIPVVEKPGGWSHSPPMVVGKKVFISAEPDTTMCLDGANRMHDVFVLELTDSGFREIAKNVVNLPVCFYSHADPVLHGKRLYYRTWGHIFCFEAKQP